MTILHLRRRTTSAEDRISSGVLDSHYHLQAPVPHVLPTHNNLHLALANHSLVNKGVVASHIPCSRQLPREPCHNLPQDMTTMSMVNDTTSLAANEFSLQSSAPSTTSSRHSWPRVVAKDGDIQHLHIQFALKNKRIERLETYIGQLKKKVNAKQIQGTADRFVSVEPVANKQAQVAVNHKEKFENDLRACLKDLHNRLALSTKAFVFGKVLQDKGFMNGMLFKQSITIMRKFYHDTVFPNHKVLAAMDQRGGTLNYLAVEVLRDLECRYWIACGVFIGKMFKAILPPETDLYCASKRIEAVAEWIVPFMIFLTPSGEGIKFNVIHVVRLLIKSYGFEDDANHRSIENWSSADAAPIMKSVGALTQGLSVNECGAISLYTKRPLCLSEMRGTSWDGEDSMISLATRDDVQPRNEAHTGDDW
jgi:hypothetical protein